MATKKAATKVAGKTATKTAAKKSPAKKASATSAESKSTPLHTLKPHPSHEDIARLAEQKWHQRGCPHGSAHVDWHAAEEELKA